MKGLFRKDGEVFTKEESNELTVSKTEPRKESKMGVENVTNLTADAEFKGTIKFSNVLKIDGKFEGELVTNEGNVVVGKTGTVKANIKVKNAIIEGKVDGNVLATEKVELRQRAHLIGDLKAKILVIEEGVVFIGQCNVNPEGFKPANQPQQP
jgi:cytoskeletal protein CcmA (bactofilin family)